MKSYTDKQASKTKDVRRGTETPRKVPVREAKVEAANNCVFAPPLNRAADTMTVETRLRSMFLGSKTSNLRLFADSIVRYHSKIRKSAMVNDALMMCFTLTRCPYFMRR